MNSTSQIFLATVLLLFCPFTLRADPDVILGDPDNLNGLVLVGSEDMVGNQDIEELYLEGYQEKNHKIQTIGFEPKMADVLDNSYADLQKQLGREITLDNIDTVTDIIRQEIRQSDTPFANVYAPPQDVENGVVYIVIRPATVEDVRIANSDYYDELRLLGKIDQNIGEPLDAKRLEDDLAILSLHPNRQLKATFSPGRFDNSMKVDIDIEEQKPWQVFVAQNNTGSDELDKVVRAYGGYHNNLWNLDHKGSFQFVTSRDESSMKGYSAKYEIPYYGAHSVSVGYNRSKTKASVLNNAFETEGDFAQLSVMHKTNLLGQTEIAPGWLLSDQVLTFGWDHKRIEGDILFTLFGNPVDTGVGADVRVNNLVAGYEGSLADVHGGETEIKANLVYSPGDIGSNNADEDFVTARSGTDSTYGYATIQVDRSVPLKKKLLEKNLVLKTGLNAQIATERLIGSERFISNATPGFRGFKSGDMTGDAGFVGYVELETSPYNLISNDHYTDAIKASVFTDFGNIINNDNVGVEDGQNKIWSIGATIKYQVNDNINSELVIAKDISAQENDSEQNIMYRLSIGY